MTISLAKQKHYIVTAGGTGGHIFPALNLCQRLIANKRKNCKITFVTDERFSEDYKAKYQELFDTGLVKIVKLPIKSFSKKQIFRFSFGLFSALIKALFLVASKKPRFIFGFGGYASLPALFWAAAFGKKILLHEQNSVIGRVNEWFLPFASRIFTSFKSTEGIKPVYAKKQSFSGMIFSLQMLAKKQMLSTQSLGPRLAGSKNSFNIFIMGGSLGTTVFASSLADWLCQIFKNNPAFASLYGGRVMVFHQINKKHEVIKPELEQIYTKGGMQCLVSSFFTNPEEIMLTSDLLVSRAGAGAVLEAALFNLPAIFVPIANSVKNHQLKNALQAQAAGISKIAVIEEKDFNHQNLEAAIKKITT